MGIHHDGARYDWESHFFSQTFTSLKPWLFLPTSNLDSECSPFTMPQIWTSCTCASYMKIPPRTMFFAQVPIPLSALIWLYLMTIGDLRRNHGHCSTCSSGLDVHQYFVRSTVELRVPAQVAVLVPVTCVIPYKKAGKREMTSPGSDFDWRVPLALSVPTPRSLAQLQLFGASLALRVSSRRVKFISTLQVQPNAVQFEPFIYM